MATEEITAKPLETALEGEIGRADDFAAAKETRGILARASGTAILHAASGGLTFALTVLLARLLGHQGYGIYAVAFAWAGILTTPAACGFDRYLVRGIAVYEVRQQWGLLRGLLLRANQIVVGISIAIAIAGMAAAVLIFSPSLRAPFCVAMLLVPLTALTLLRQGAMQAFGRVVIGQCPEYLIRPICIIAGVMAIDLISQSPLTPTEALAGNVAAVTVAFLVGTLLLRRTVPRAIRGIDLEVKTRAWIRAALPMMVVSGVWVANSYASILLIGGLDNASAAGVYSVVQKGAEVIVLVLIATNMSLAPTIARMYARGDRRSLEYATERMARATLAGSVPLAAVFIVFPQVYLGIFGPGFDSGVVALQVIAIGQLVNAAAGSAGPALMMTGHERVAVKGVALGLLSNIVLGCLLIPPLGVTGAAIAFATSLVIWNLILVWLARRHVGVNVTALPFLSMQNERLREPEDMP